VRESLRRGHAYVAHDWLCDPTGFSFVALTDRGKIAGMMGDEAGPGGIALKAVFPVSCTIKVIFNGAVKSVIEDDTANVIADQPGVYRVEGWLTVDGEQRPWIYSNPIRVRFPG